MNVRLALSSTAARRALSLSSLLDSPQGERGMGHARTADETVQSNKCVACCESNGVSPKSQILSPNP